MIKRKDWSHPKLSHEKEMEHPKKIKAKFLRKISKSDNMLLTVLGGKKEAKKMYIWFDFNFILKLFRKKAKENMLFLCVFTFINMDLYYLCSQKNSFNFNIKIGRKYIKMLTVIFFNQWDYR